MAAAPSYTEEYYEDAFWPQNMSIFVTTSTQVGSDQVSNLRALPDNLGSWFLVCNLILTQLERRPQKKMEDYLKKKGKKGRRPQKKKMKNGRRPQNKIQWKTT